MTLRRLFREPLVHFLALGLLLFGLYALVAPAGGAEEDIVISGAVIAGIRDQYMKLWGRPPTAAEMQALIAARVDDEMLYREGRAMGLDRDDAVIKRRVRQKYDLMAEEEAGAAPTDADLAAYLNAHPDRFRAAPVVSFRQMMVSPDGSAADVRARIAAMAKALQAGASPDTMAGSGLLPASQKAASLDMVARDFGSRFADALLKAPVGAWSGPIASAYGLHLVRVESREPAAVPPLDRVRGAVAREWENDRRTRAREARMAELRQRYDVTIETLPGETVPS